MISEQLMQVRGRTHNYHFQSSLDSEVSANLDSDSETDSLDYSQQVPPPVPENKFKSMIYTKDNHEYVKK